MKLDRDVNDLSTGGKAALVGVLALCCLVPMLIVFGAVSITGALFGGGAMLAVGAVAVLVWMVWMGRHHRSMTHSAPDHDHDAPSGV